jgi:hypothetical protein
LYISSSVKKVVTIVVFFISFLFLSTGFAQELTIAQKDSLYYKFLQLRTDAVQIPSDKLITLTAEDRKCGFELMNTIKFNFDSFSPERQYVLKPLLQRKILHTSIVSASGFFRIHYDTTDIRFNIPAYINGASVVENIAEVVRAFDSTYFYEVTYLGYPAPPSDNGAGGDDLYDIYIVNQPTGLYGFTAFENEITPGSKTFDSYIEIDNDYTGFFSEGVFGLRVTAAHEFHHAIQGGNYILRTLSTGSEDDTYFYELTSTAFEEFVYDDVNDYYQYLDSYFRRTDIAMPSQNGYNLAIWNIFLKENFGADIIKQQWELMPNQSAITAINNTITFSGSTFPRELNKFGIWTYFTSYRAVPGLYFSEAANYPLIVPTSTIQFTPPSELFQMNAAPTANSFIRFNISINGDTLFAIVSNGDAISAVSNPNSFFNFDYTFFSDGSSGDRELTENYSSTFNVSNPSFWSVSEILNDQIVREDSAIKHSPGGITYAYPNPFSYSRLYLTGALIFFSTKLSVGEIVDFNVYTSGMQLVYTEQKNIQNLPGSQKGVSWNGLDNDENKLSSGVYIYVIRIRDNVEMGKVVIFNE